MVSLVIDVKVLPGKLKEFSQTIDFLIQEFRLEEGCLSYVYKCQNKNRALISVPLKFLNCTIRRLKAMSCQKIP